MKIFLCTLLVIFMALLSSFATAKEPEKYMRHGVEYGVINNYIIYPKGTYEVEYDEAGDFKIKFVYGPGQPFPEDILRRAGYRLAKPDGPNWSQLNEYGGFAVIRGKRVGVKIRDGDKLERKGIYVGIYEGTRWCMYTRDFQHPVESY